jgi:DNA-binding response OmpR family regulator
MTRQRTPIEPPAAPEEKGTDIMETITATKESFTSQHALKRLLESQGYNVDIVGDSNGVAHASPDVKPVAIILDLTLPHTNGNGAEPDGDHGDVQVPPVLVAVRHTRKSPLDDVLQLGEVSVDFRKMELTRGEEAIPLTKKEFETLRFLSLNAGRVISRQELLNEVWGYKNYGSTRIVDNVIVKLRHKIEKDPAHPVHLRTIHGTGYKFIV